MPNMRLARADLGRKVDYRVGLTCLRRTGAFAG